MSESWDVDVICCGTINGVIVNGMRWKIRTLPHGSEWSIGTVESDEAGTLIRYCGDDVRDRTDRTITQMQAAVENRPPAADDLVLETSPATQLTSLPGGRPADRPAPVTLPGARPRDQGRIQSG